MSKTEIWKDIKGYEGLYQVSNFGRVKSLERKKLKENGVIQTVKEKILNLHERSGYYRVVVQKDYSRKTFSIHRLVAMAFIPNPNDYPIINHKDENPSNNHIDNLEWCTFKYNTNYGTCVERRNKSNSIKVYQYDLEGNFIRSWENSKEAEGFGYDPSSIIKCCKGIRKIHKNSQWSRIPLEGGKENVN